MVRSGPRGAHATAMLRGMSASPRAPGGLGAVLRDAGAEALSLLLPIRCAGCDVPDVGLCPACRDELAPRVRRGRFDAGLAVFSAREFSGVPARVLRALKEDGRTALARPLGAALAAAAKAAAGGPVEDVLVVPVPSSRAAFRRRGHEVAGLIARRGGLRPLRALRTVGAVADQRGLGRVARAQNVAGTMRARGVEGAPVLIVDDIVTTGATLREAARALTDAGARVVGAATVAATARHAR